LFVTLGIILRGRVNAHFSGFSFALESTPVSRASLETRCAGMRLQS
jgi:hypothetical protein